MLFLSLKNQPSITVHCLRLFSFNAVIFVPVFIISVALHVVSFQSSGKICIEHFVFDSKIYVLSRSVYVRIFRM